MITVSLKFLSGRYHATPWGRHVNEGAIEWPPSPWRILRALVATWKRTLPNLTQNQVEPILRALADPPVFVLPPASTSHSRHYMPWFKKGPSDRTLVFDTFVAVPRDAELFIHWPDLTMDAAQRAVLDRILTNLNILGRSESWCEASLATLPSNSKGMTCRPLNGEASHDHEIVRLLCPDPIHAFRDDYIVSVTTKTEGRGKNKLTVEQRSTVYDPAWNLCMETLQLHRDRWSDPPGSRWMQYTRSRNCFKIEPGTGLRTTITQSCIQVARFALDSTVLPLVTETLRVAEAARRAIMSIHGKLTQQNGARGRSSVFSGKNEDGSPLLGHRHAYYLPTDEDGDGRLDHLTVFAQEGFDSAERRALDEFRRLNTGRRNEEDHPLRLLLLGLGRIDEIAGGPLQKSRVWVSATPYIATRHAKRRGRDAIDMASPEARAEFLISDMRAQLATIRPDVASKGGSEVQIECEWDRSLVFRTAGGRRPIEFQRCRRKPGDDGGQRLAGAFRMTFDIALSGPVVLGWSSHFGMGLFVPVAGD